MGRTRKISDEDLLASARAAFIEGGFAVPTREVARRAGISEGVLFQRYATKAELFFAAMVLPAPRLGDLAEPPLASPAQSATGDGRLCRLTAGLLDYFRQTLPVLLPLMSHPGFRFEEFARTHPGSPLDVLRRDLVAFFRREQQAGRIGPVDPGAAALVVLSLAQCIAFFEQVGAHGGRFPEEILGEAVRCLWDGVAPRAAAARPVPARASTSPRSSSGGPGSSSRRRSSAGSRRPS
jgi:AcrR family transcriptional regulator